MYIEERGNVIDGRGRINRQNGIHFIAKRLWSGGSSQMEIRNQSFVMKKWLYSINYYHS